jgi:cell division GTPase FtsZ
MYQVNAGRSLKTLAREADATLLVDNDAWRAAGESVEEGYDAINGAIARRFGLLLAAGEAVEGVGESVVDTSEVINTLRAGGIAALGYATADSAPDAGENVNAVTSTARRALLTGTSLPDATDAEAALLAVAGEPERISRKGVEHARRWLEEETGCMQVRGGDFPLGSERIAALVLLGGVERSDRVQRFFDRAKAAQEETDEVEAEREAGDGAFQNDELENLL